MTSRRKAMWGWALYDWANSAFATTVMAGFFPLFFKQYWSAGADPNLSTARLGLANSLASLVVALLAPVLGAIADRGGARKRFLLLFAYLGVLMTGCLFWVEKGAWQWAVLLYLGGNIGFAGANSFYDALLPTVAGKDRVDFVSGLGYSLGYLGGGLLFLGNVLMVLHPGAFALAGPAQAVRLSFLSVALWWGGFTLFLVRWLPEERAPGPAPGWRRALAQGLGQIGGTLKRLRRLPMLWLFLLAYWFYIDGVDTIIRMAVDYGLSLGFHSQDLIKALLITQFVGFPSALAFGRLARTWGVRRCLYLAMGVYALVCLLAMGMSRPLHFYLLATAIGLVQGGIQALSRSYYTRLIPPGQEAEFFGFFNMLGKFAAILGPALVGGVGLWLRHLLLAPGASPQQVEAAQRLASRGSIGSVVLLFVLGAALFYFVDEEKGARQAREQALSGT